MYLDTYLPSVLQNPTIITAQDIESPTWPNIIIIIIIIITAREDGRRKTRKRTCKANPCNAMQCIQPNRTTAQSYNTPAGEGEKKNA